jgi:hypothetical protein
VTAPLTKLYHAKRSVRLRGAKLDGWSPKDVAGLAKRSMIAKVCFFREKRKKPTGKAAEFRRK